MRNIFILLFLFIFVSGSGNCESIQTRTSGAEKDFLSSGLTGTLPLQARVLIEINTALVHGSISREQAVILRQAVDGLGEKEDRRLAAGNPVSQTDLRQDSSDLNGIRAQLERFVQSVKAHEFAGSALRQDQVSSEINRCLTQGKISVVKATDLRKKVNLICANESWSLTTGSGTIPEKVIEQDVKELNDLDEELMRKLVGSKKDTAL